MDYQNKEHMKGVLKEYEKLPDVDMLDKKLKNKNIIMNTIISMFTGGWRL